MSTKVIIPCRLSYANVWEPKADQRGRLKYSCSLIIPKSDTRTIQAIEAAIEEAIDAGLGKFNGKRPKTSAIKTPLRDGDLERDDEAYADSMFLNASTTTPPQIVDARVKPILDREEVYSGCYANVSVNFYAFSVDGNRGIAAGMGNIQKVRDGARIDGRVSAENEFSAIETDEDDFLG